MAPEHPQTAHLDVAAARKSDRLPWVLAATFSFVLCVLTGFDAVLHGIPDDAPPGPSVSTVLAIAFGAAGCAFMVLAAWLPRRRARRA